MGCQSSVVLSVKYVTADFDDPTSLRQVLDGVERVFLVTNLTECVEEQQLRFVEIASEAGVRRVVYLSQLHSAKILLYASCGTTQLRRSLLLHQGWSFTLTA